VSGARAGGGDADPTPRITPGAALLLMALAALLAWGGARGLARGAAGAALRQERAESWERDTGGSEVKISRVHPTSSMPLPSSVGPINSAIGKSISASPSELTDLADDFLDADPEAFAPCDGMLSVRGRLVNAAGDPVTGVAVLLAVGEDGARDPTAGECVSDADGVFLLGPFPARPQTYLLVRAEQYHAVSLVMRAPVEGLLDAGDVVLKHYTGRVIPSIRGTVTGPDGAARFVAMVCLAPESDGTSALQVLHRSEYDGGGHFTFWDVPPGRYVVGVESADGVESAQASVRIASETDVVEVALTLLPRPESCRLLGRVVQGPEPSNRGRWLELHTARERPWSRRQQVWLSDDGTFDARVPPGAYTLEDDLVPVGSPPGAPPVTIEAPAGGIVRLDLRARGVGTIRGRITGLPAPPSPEGGDEPVRPDAERCVVDVFAVSASRPESMTRHRGRIHGEDSFVFEGVRAARYLVLARCIGAHETGDCGAMASAEVEVVADAVTEVTLPWDTPPWGALMVGEEDLERLREVAIEVTSEALSDSIPLHDDGVRVRPGPYIARLQWKTADSAPSGIESHLPVLVPSGGVCVIPVPRFTGALSGRALGVRGIAEWIILVGDHTGGRLECDAATGAFAAPVLPAGRYRLYAPRSFPVDVVVRAGETTEVEIPEARR